MQSNISQLLTYRSDYPLFFLFQLSKFILFEHLNLLFTDLVFIADDGDAWLLGFYNVPIEEIFSGGVNEAIDDDCSCVQATNDAD